MNYPFIEPLESRIAPANVVIDTPAATPEGNDPLAPHNLDFTVRLVAAMTTTATVDFTTVDGTATVADGDYTLTVGTLTFLPGETVKTVHVPIHGDTTFEPTETFKVRLSNATGGATILPSPRNAATGTITNDDAGPTPTVSIDSIQFLEEDATSGTATFHVTLSNESISTITVTATTAGNTATSPADFSAKSQVLTFAPGETSKEFTVQVVDDQIHEGDETFRVNLTAANNATLGTAQGTGTIIDNDPVPTISLDAGSLTVSTIEGNVGTRTAIFTVKLSNPSSESISVTATANSDTATAGRDFTAISQVLTFAPGETSKDFSVSILGDITDENDESYFVDLTSPSANSTLGTSHAVGKILNDDVQISVADISSVESDGDKVFTFNVLLSAASSHVVSVNFATQDGTAISTGATKDFDSAGGTLTFAPGITNMPVQITVHGDTTGELDENFFLNLTNGMNAVVARSKATGTILNDDPSVSISDAQILEGNASGTTEMVFTVTLDHRSGTDSVTVQVSTSDDVAKAGSDYTALAPTTLTFLAGEMTKQVKVAVTRDTTPEANETFFVKLSNPSANVGIARGTGTGTILNDDGAVLTINDVTVTEGDSGTKNAVFVVRLLTSASQAVTVKVATEAVTVTASSGGDFIAITRTLTFAVGTTQQTFIVPIIGDLISESTETFLVRLSNATGGATIARDAGIGTILDNNDPVPTVSIGNGFLAEGNSGTAPMKFTLTLSQPSDVAVTVAYATHDIANAAHLALAGSDYSASNGTVTFAPGQTTADIFVPIFGDTTNEFDETFGVTLSSPGGATIAKSEGIGTIQNDEVTISIDDVSTLEGNSGTTSFLFHVTLNIPNGQPLQNNVTVNFATVDGTAISTGANKDFTATQGTLTFTPSTGLRQDIVVSVVGDARFEGNQQFFVNLLSSVNATIVGAQAIGTIQDDDAVTISIQDAAINEGDSGTSDMSFSVSLDHVSDLPVTVKVSTVNGTALATAGAVLNDFTAITDQTITFAPGETSKTVTVKVVGDTVDELKTENFTVKLSAPTNATLLKDTGTGTITDNDQRILSVGDVSIIEGNTGTKTVNFTVFLSRASLQVVSFDYATADNSAVSTGATPDFVAKSGTGTIAAGQTSTTVSVTVNGDTVLEGNERFFLNLLSSPNANISPTAGRGVATIVDDDAGGARLQLVPVNGTSFTEGDTVAEFSVVRTGSLAQAVSVQFETVDDTTTSDGTLADYIARSGTISFAAGSSTASGTIRIAIKGDINYENDEVFQVRLFNPVSAAVLDGNNNPAVESFTDVTILDDGDAVPTLSIVDERIVEGNSGSHQVGFKVRLVSADGLPVANERDVVTVHAKTANDTNSATPANSTGGIASVKDYDPIIDTTLTFAKGETDKTIFVSVNGDLRDEPAEETFDVLLSGAVNAVVSKGTGVGTILDDDNAPTVQFLSSTVTVAEGDTGLTSATFTLKLSEISELPVSVKVSTRDGTAVSTGPNPDFVALTNFLASYTPGSQSATFTFDVSIVNDTRNEASESFAITLSDAINATIAGAGGIGTITDNDPAPLVTVGGASLSEGSSGTTDLVFTVSLSSESEQTVSVDFATADGTAVSIGAMADFIATKGTLTFAPGVTSQDVHVKIIGDTFKEKDETFSLNLSRAVNGDISVAPSGTGTILADGDSIVGITIHDAFVVEGNSGTAQLNFTIELSDTLASSTTFVAVAVNGTAVRGTDFNAIANPVGTINAGVKTGTVVVTVNGDTAFEATESMFVGLRNVESAGETIAVVGGAGRGTIFNDDLRRVDNQTIQFIDVDGDLATIHLSKGVLSTNALSFSDANTSVGGRQLQVINLIGNTQLQNADLSVTAARQPGFRGDAQGVRGDGHVNVGAIFAAIVQPDVLEFINGIDLGIVTIDGDLGRIVAGDGFVTSAIKSLNVRTMGRLGTGTQGTGNLSLTSLVLGPIDNLNVVGSFAGFLDVLGAQFGTIRNLNIGGALLGGSDANSGRILFSGRIDNGFISKIVGGTGANSGLLSGSDNGNSHITNVRVGGLVSGGSGENSGTISAPLIRSVTIGGLAGGSGRASGVVTAQTLDRVVVRRDVVGGSGESSGDIFASSSLGFARLLFGEVRGGAGLGSGLIGSAGTVGTVSVFGAIFGGAGEKSGRITAAGTIGTIRTGAIVGGSGVDSGTILGQGSVGSLSVFGKIIGGSANNTGGVSIVGTLVNGFIGDDILGGDSTAGTSLTKTGFVAVGSRIRSLTVNGDLVSGENGGTSLGLSGEIFGAFIDFLHIRGSILGNEGTVASIGGFGDIRNAAIRSLRIDGDVRFAEIIAGYGSRTTADSVLHPRGIPINSDARIGNIRIGGDFASSSIVAGVDAGTDGLFGTVDDFPIGGTGTTNVAGAVSRIASIVIGGNILPGTISSGIEAQHVVAVSVNGISVPLTRGSGNDDEPGTELKSGSMIRVFEVPVV